MPRVTNLCNVAVSLVLKDGKTATLRAGATESLDYDLENEHNRQMLSMGAVAKGDAKEAARASEAARAAPRKTGRRSAPKAAKAPKAARGRKARSESPAPATEPVQE